MPAALLTQTHGDAAAVFDPTYTYRYRLTRRWGGGDRVVFVMLNPSTATAQCDDPTIRRVSRFAREHCRAGRLDVVNLFALRSSDPRRLLVHPDPIGPANDEVLQRTVLGADTVVAAWGAKAGPRGAQVRRLLLDLGVVPQVLRLTRGGAPAHPLYLPASTAPTPWLDDLRP